MKNTIYEKMGGDTAVDIFVILLIIGTWRFETLPKIALKRLMGELKNIN